MKKYWFKPKEYGWGVFPTSWQGIITTLVLLLLLLTAAYVNGLFNKTPTFKEFLRFILDTLIISSLFCLVVNDKTDGGVKWRWGKTNEE